LYSSGFTSPLPYLNDIGDGWNGLIDDFRVYNRAITQSEISLLATRRGIAYERTRAVRAFISSGSPPPTTNRRNNLLVGMGF